MIDPSLRLCSLQNNRVRTKIWDVFFLLTDEGNENGSAGRDQMLINALHPMRRCCRVQAQHKNLFQRDIYGGRLVARNEGLTV